MMNVLRKLSRALISREHVNRMKSRVKFLSNGCFTFSHAE